MSVHDTVHEKKVLEDAKNQNLQFPVYKSAPRKLKYRSIWSALSSLQPEFLIPSDEPSKPLRPTAYLDGLRGFAAFLVYIHHHELWAHEPFSENPIFETAYGHDDKRHFIALPFIRVLFGGGHYAVSIFFVISGYVLTAKPLRLIQAGDISALGDNIASALFRRWIRLYIPLIATTTIFFTTWHLFDLWVPANKPQKDFTTEVGHYFREFSNFSWLFRTKGDPWFQYNFHTWSIPTEFMGSIVVYTTALALARTSRNVRLAIELLLFFLATYIVDGWYLAMFLAGMLMSDLDLLARNNDLPSFFYRLKPYKTPIIYTLFIISLYLGGVPSHTQNVLDLRKNHGWYYLSFLDPMAGMDYKWFYLIWASWMLVLSAQHIGWLRRFFETGFCQYLGRISFSLYLVHGPVIWTIGHRLYVGVGMAQFIDEGYTPWWSKRFVLPKTGPMGMEVSLLVPNILLLPFTLWMAELAMRWFDEPSVKFAQWLYLKTLPPKPSRAAR